MEVEKIINAIETFAPLDLQSSWDCSGWAINNGHFETSAQNVIARQNSSPCHKASTEAIFPYFDKVDIKKILLALTVNEEIINQAVEKRCDLIISHHPLFFVPFSYNKGIPIYSAHTNLDTAKGGTTDSLISLLGFNSLNSGGDFLRLVELENEICLTEFISILKKALNIDSLRVVNKYGTEKIKKIAFCAGSGADFLEEVENLGVDVFVTGDVKFHTAFDSKIVLVDIGHFESERPVLETVKKLLLPLGIEVIIADEKSPFDFC